MKRHYRKSKFAPKPPPKAAIARSTTQILPSRKWLFRVAALGLLPVSVLVTIELILRVTGYGYSTHFFEKVRLNDRVYLVNNEDFSFRFFPPQLARWPGPVMIEAQKPANTCRIFVLGESAARGEPEPNYAASRYLQAMLEQRHPQTRFEVVNLGITAINSHVILPIARDCARADGDLWIVYMGNNEMVGPFGAATVFGAKAPPLSVVRLNLALRSTRLGQLLSQAEQLFQRGGTNQSWGGMKMFLGNQISPDEPRREVVYQNYARNLEDILDCGIRSGTKILLNTVAVNLRDCPPLASVTNTALSAEDAMRMSTLLDAAGLAAATNLWPEAIQKFEAAAKLDPNNPELHYRWAQSLLKTGDTQAAREHFQKACDFDALPFRADSRINKAITEAARRHKGAVAFLDAANLLAAQAPGGVCGDETFYEHVHFNFDGQYRLALAWAPEVEKLLPSEATAQTVGNRWATQPECEARLGLTDWNRCQVTEDIIRRLAKPPLSLQFNNAARVTALQEVERSLRQKMSPATEVQARNTYLAALHQAPEDALLCENFAEFYESGSHLAEALAQREQALALRPHDPQSDYQVGRLENRLNRFDQAEKHLLAAITLRPRDADSWSELGSARLGLGKNPEALEDFQKAAQLDPTDAMNPALAGRSLAQLNRHAEAMAAYRRALALNPNLWQVRLALGDELAAGNQVEAAVNEYQTVLRQKPDNSMAHQDLGAMWARQGRYDEALAEFEQALRLDPSNTQAKDYYSRVQARKLAQP